MSPRHAGRQVGVLVGHAEGDPKGETATAQEAATTLLRLDKQALWRRLQVTALEDVGVGDIGLVTRIIAAAGDSGWRKHHGGDETVAHYLIEQMCDAPKDRSGDNLTSAADHHPDLEDDRGRLAVAGTGELLEVVLDRDRPLGTRVVAAWYAVGTERYLADRLTRRRGDPEAVFEVFGSLGVTDSLIATCRLAARRMRDPFPFVIPLVWTELDRSGDSSVEEVEVPPARTVRGVPLYALDKHTRSGKRPLRRFLGSCEPLWRYLWEHLEARHWQKAVDVAVFHAESGVVRRRLVWERADEIGAAGVEADLFKCGLGLGAIDGLLDMVRDHLPDLDAIRDEIIEDMADPPQRDLFADAAG